LLFRHKLLLAGWAFWSQLPDSFVLSAFIGVHRRPISGFAFGGGREEKHIWPPMNADERR
jgi:hypothetical protein